MASIISTKPRYGIPIQWAVLGFLTSMPLAAHRILGSNSSFSLSVYITAVPLLTGVFIVYYLEQPARLTELRLSKYFGPHLWLMLLLEINTIMANYQIFKLRYIVAHFIWIVLIVLLGTTLPKVKPINIFRAFFIGGLGILTLDILKPLGLVEGQIKQDIFGLGYAGIGIVGTFSGHGGGMILGLSSTIVLMFYNRGHRFRQAIYAFIAFMEIVAIIFSQSRSSYLATLLALTVFAWYRFEAWKISLRQKFMIFVTAGFIGMFLFLAVLIPYLAGVRESTVTHRLGADAAAVVLLSEHPEGIGWGTWMAEYDTDDRAMHNMILNYSLANGVSSGIIVMAQIMWLLVLVLLVRYYSIRRGGGDDLLFGYGICAAGLGGVSVSMFSIETPSEWINICTIVLAAFATRLESPMPAWWPSFRAPRALAPPQHK